MVTTISPEALRGMLDDEEEFVLIDTRRRGDFEGWRIREAENVPFGSGESVDPDAVRTLADPEDRIVTVCAKGISSYAFAEQLEQAGYDDVTVVQDGMEGWSRVYDVVSIPTRDPGLDVFQVRRRAKGCLGYVVGSAGEAAVIDPTRHADEFVAVAEDAGYEVTRILDTHVHADHVSGGRRLADELGVPFHLGAAAADRVAFDYDPIERNDAIRVGDAEIKAVSTPGHTTDAVSYLLDAEALFTGDTLFVESVGRTELQFGDGRASEGAELLYESLHGTVLAEPDSISVLPGHVSVSADGEYSVAPGEPVVSTVEALRTGATLLDLDREEFIERLTDRLPEKPPNYETVVAVNEGRRELEDEQEAVELELGPNRCAATGD